MALSEDLTKLATRIKELEDRAAAAKGEAKVDLQQDVKQVREAAQADADELRTAPAWVSPGIPRTSP